MRAICANPASPLGENDFFRNQTGKLGTIGYAIAGFGISALVPILYSKANKTKAMPAASALTFVGSMGFLGSFMGPPLIGHVAQATCLSLALGIFAVLILVCLFLRFDND